MVDRVNRALHPTAFERRPPDIDGLSFGVASEFAGVDDYVEPENCGLTRVHGVATHHSGSIRATRVSGAPLDVLQERAAPGHAVIPNTPYGSVDRDSDEFSNDAHHVAVMLSKQSRLIWVRRPPT